MTDFAPFEYDGVPPVRTEAGMLRGYRLDGMYHFKGVPYAQAKRFQPPQPPFDLMAMMAQNVQHRQEAVIDE